MSAYVVDDNTINKIVAFFTLDTAGDAKYLGHHRNPLATLGYLLGYGEEEPRRLAKDMFALNVRAVDVRYGKGQAAEFRPLDFEYKSVLPQPVVHTIKALGCWLYQCSEGDVPKTPLYIAMAKIRNTLCRCVVYDLPAYNEAPWG